MPKLTIAFDVNGTLTKEPMRRLLTALNRDQCRVIVWSSLGEAYAKAFCKKYGLTADEYAHKDTHQVDIAVDDLAESVSMAQCLLVVS